MKPNLNRRRLLAAALILLAVVGTAAAVTTLFTAGAGVTINSTNGPAVTLGEDLGLEGANPVGTDGSVTIQNTTVDGPAGSTTTITGPDSAAPTLSGIDSAGGTIEADTVGIQTIGASGISSITYQDVDLQSSTTEFDVSGTGTLYVHGFAAGQWVRVNRANGDDTLVQADGSGVAAISISSGAQLTLVEPKGGPTLTNPSPTGGETFSTPPVELSVNVTDGDFATSNEEVTLEWYVDGSLDGTTTVTSNGTATFESSATNGGTHEWYVVATDATGQSDQSGSDSNPHTFALPDELRIYEETNPNTLVTGNDTNPVQVELRFYSEGEEQVIERSTTDGTISLQGLPTEKEFIVTADAEGYKFRRIIVDSLIEQQDVFLLPDDEPSSRVIFVLDDQTGQFDPVDTRLYVEKALNQSGDVRYRVIAGDRFGSSAEFPVALQDGERYRLRVENEEGRVRTLGAYTVSGDARATLPLGRVEIDTSMQQGIAFGAALEETTQNGVTTRVARVDYLDPEALTSELSIEIVRVDGGTESVVTTDTITSPGQRHVGTYQLPSSHPENATYDVRYVAQRDGTTIEGSRRIGAVEEIADELGVDSGVLELLGYAAIISLTGLVVVISPALASIVAVVVAAFTTLLGITPIPGPAIGIAGATALMYNVARVKGVR